MVRPDGRFNTFVIGAGISQLGQMSLQLVKDQEVFQSQQQWLSYVSGALEVLKAAGRKVPQREIFVAVSAGELVGKLVILALS